MNSLLRTHLFIGLATLSLGSLHAQVTLPYSNDFSAPNDPPTGFIEGTDSQWSVGSGVYTNSIVNSGTATVSYSAVQTTGRGATADFVVSSTFTRTPTSSGNFTIGLAALATGADLSGTNSAVNFYLADISQTGALRIGRFTGNSFSQLASTSVTAPALDAEFTLTLTGTYSGTNELTLSLEISGASTGSVVTTAIAAPFAGDYFGYRNRAGTASNGALTVDADNFSVTTSAIPEPSSAAALAGLGMLGLAALRRRPRA